MSNAIPEPGSPRILRWFPNPRGEASALKGYFDLEWGPFVIRRMVLHVDDVGAYSVGVPMRKDTPEGPWIHLFDFVSRLAREEFRHAALQALLAFFEEQRAKCA